MTAIEEIRTRQDTIELDAKLALDLAAALEANNSDITAWEALRYMANTMQETSRILGIVFQ